MMMRWRRGASFLHECSTTRLLNSVVPGRVLIFIVFWMLGSDRRLAARKALPYSQRLLVEDDEARLRKALGAESKKGDPNGKVARGLARLQVHAAVADPDLLAAAKKCVATAARREGLAAEAARLEKKGELREALQQCVIFCRCRRYDNILSSAI
jgi:hypothetical protein